MRKLYIPILLGLVFLCACSNSPDSELIKASKNFDKIYYEIIKNIDINDFDGMLAILESDINAERFAELRSIITKIEQIEPSTRLKQLKTNIINKYDDMIFLIDALKYFGTLTEDERGRFDRIRIFILKDIKDSK